MADKVSRRCSMITPHNDCSCGTTIATWSLTYHTKNPKIKVRASLVDAKDLSASAFKVVTERNVVYLMGRVTQREAQRATEIARGVSGVSKVVRVFEMLTEDELRNITPAPVVQDAPPASTPRN